MSKKLLLYLPFESDFYNGLYIQMKKGFEQAGCIVEGGCGYQHGDELLKKIDLFQPDFVFEMNRVKSEIENFPKNLIHICWLVDYWERTPEQIFGSDFLYLFSQRWLVYHKNYSGKFIGILYPGTDVDIYHIKPQKERKKSIIFLGHMPKPWIDIELNREIPTLSGQTILFKDILQPLREYLFNPRPLPNGTSLFDNLNINFESILDGSLRYDIRCRAGREGRRIGVLEKFLNSEIELNIYGNAHWKLREEFKMNYRGFLSSPKAMNNTFNENSYLLHDNETPHFRVFDAMASGLLVLRPDPTGYGVADEWNSLNFKEGIDILTYQLHSKEFSCIKQFNATTQLDLQMHRREQITSSHTWKHRANKILKDIEIYT